MRYQFVTDSGREATLKRHYRRFQLLVGVLVVALVGFVLAFRPLVHSHGVIVVLAFSAAGVGSALYLGSLRKRDGIDGAELLQYMMRQPMMIIVQIIMAISVIVHLYQVFFKR